MDLLTQITQERQDAILWQCGQWIGDTSNTREKAKAIHKISNLISQVRDEVLRNEYIKEVSSEYRIKATDLKNAVNEEVKTFLHDLDNEEANDSFQFPPWVDEKEVMTYGFAEQVSKHHTGYYFFSGNHFEQSTNFVITPLYHIYSQNSADNRRMISVTNGFEERIVELPSTKMLSTESFCGELYNHGTFLPKDKFGKPQLLKILNKVSQDFILCHELQRLGWQAEEGFFAFSNKTYLPPSVVGSKGELNEYNEYGVAKVGEQYFLSPSNSKSNELVRSADNIYENDMYLKHVNSPINFEQWADLMVKAYKQHALFAISFVVATIFRDLIIKVTKIPHLYAYGGVGAGKSEFGESVNNLFFSGKNSQGELYKPFNLNQGTEYAFWNGMERFNNCPFVLNEFDENAIDDNRFRAIKSAYDSEGRAKGLKDKNRATMQKVVCTVVLLGQYLGTKDDNAVLMRSLPLQFKAIEERPEEQVEAYNSLKQHEHNGISGILLELLDLRPLFAKQFAELFSITRKTLLAELKEEQKTIPERIIKNISCMIAINELVSFNKKLPFSKEDFYQYAKQAAIQMGSLISSTSSISEFWRMLEFLFEKYLIKEGADFKVEMNTTSVTVQNEQKDKEVKTFAAKSLLFLRINTVHTLYLQEQKKATGKTGLNQQTLLLYMKDQPYYVGYMKGKKFDKGVVSTCYVFDYDMLDINLVREQHNDEGKVSVIEGIVLNDISEIGNDLGKFTVVEYHIDTNSSGDSVTHTNYFKCFVRYSDGVATITKDSKIRMKGLLRTEQGYNNKQTYIMDVQDFESIPRHQAFTSNFGMAENTLPENINELPFGND